MKTKRSRPPAAKRRAELAALAALPDKAIDRSDMPEILDWSKAKPNPYAARLRGRTVAVVLEPDVAEAFPTSKSVNTLLRSVLAAIPRRASSKRTVKRKALARKAG